MKNNKMVKFGILVVLCLGLAIGVLGYEYDMSYECPNDLCVRDGPIFYTFTLYNKGTDKIQIREIVMSDAINGSNHTRYKGYENDIKIPIITVYPTNDKTVTFEGLVPAANQGSYVNLRPCFVRKINIDEHFEIWDGIEEIAYCENDNLTFPIVQCLRNSHCKQDENCIDRTCVPFDCGECQFAYKHKCANYECCSSDYCGRDEMCANNTCVELGCQPHELFFNHTCLAANCSVGEIIKNNQCVDVGCEDNQEVIGEECIDLDCDYNEYAALHACQPLECADNEGYVDHACEILSCTENQTIENHECKDLNCGMFKYIDTGQCRFDWQYLIKLIIEIVVVVGIIVFIVLDIRKIRKQKKAAANAQPPPDTQKAFTKKEEVPKE